MYDRILVPTDGSSGVERAVTHALDLAAVHEASIHSIFVINTASFASVPMETSWEGLTEILHDDAQEALEHVKMLADQRGRSVETTVIEGSPSREIVSYAHESGCDLIVMGTHGRGGIDRLLLGSVAERVVRTAAVPVLKVRVGDSGKVDETTGRGGDAVSESAD